MTPLIETKRAILFDLDGTILDNMDLMFNSLKETMQVFGYPELTEEKHATLIGMGLRPAMIKLGIKLEQLEDFICYRLEVYKRLANHVSIFEGIHSLLGTLEKAGCILGIVTGSNNEIINLTPAALEAVSMVNVIVTADDTPEAKPDPAPICCALKKLGIDGSQAVFIGDAPHDIESAQRAGCLSFLAAWNHLGVDLQFTYQPDYTVNTVRELQSILLGDH